MKRRLYRALVALTMILILFCFSACGGTTDTTNEETFPETEEESEESEEVESEETESEAETEEETVTDIKVVDGEYKIYPAFIKTFELNDNVLKVETENVFEDYEMPTEMAINFEYPLSDEVVWSDTVAKITDEEDFDWFEWFAFYLEGVTMAAERYNNGQYEGVYTSGQDFCEKNAIWTFVIKDETVQSISMDLVKDETEGTTAAEIKTEESESAPSAKEDAPASTPTPAPVHTHSYNGSVTKEANCASNGTKVYTCSCGDSYTESIAANGNHTWKEIYGTVEHASQGEMRQVQVGTSGEVVACNYCGSEFGDDYAFLDHCRSFVGSDNNHARATYTYRGGQPIYENQWIVTSEAWTETVVTGYQCTTCGATK